jgi:hypothetical protein
LFFKFNVYYKQNHHVTFQGTSHCSVLNFFGVVINYKKITFFCDEVKYKFNMSVVLDIKNMLGDSVVFFNIISPNVCSPLQIAKKG